MLRLRENLTFNRGWEGDNMTGFKQKDARGKETTAHLLHQQKDTPHGVEQDKTTDLGPNVKTPLKIKPQMCSVRDPPVAYLFQSFLGLATAVLGSLGGLELSEYRNTRGM